MLSSQKMCQSPIIFFPIASMPNEHLPIVGDGDDDHVDNHT